MPLLPELLVVRNSDIPVADNDGALWAGRGASVLIRGGLAARAGRVALVLAPELAYARNLGFASTPSFLGGQQPGTGPFAAPWLFSCRRYFFSTLYPLYGTTFTL